MLQLGQAGAAPVEAGWTMVGPIVLGDEMTVGPLPFVLEWAVAAAPAVHESSSCDRHLVHQADKGVLLVVLDALGEGTRAAAAADRALESMRWLASPRLDFLLEQCHQTLQDTPGLLAAIAWLDHDAVMTWLSVGNVTAVLLRRRYAGLGLHSGAMAHAGVLGGALPRVGARAVQLQSGDTVVMATGGVSVELGEDFLPRADLRHTARRVLEKRRIAGDDALILVARCTLTAHSTAITSSDA